MASAVYRSGAGKTGKHPAWMTGRPPAALLPAGAVISRGRHRATLYPDCPPASRSGRIFSTIDTHRAIAARLPEAGPMPCQDIHSVAFHQ
jgi:hypothetical protein